jgi:hypothetical protein
MSITAVAGPLVAFGQAPNSDYNPELAPSLVVGGMGLLDPRNSFTYQPGQNFGSATMGFLDAFSSVTVNYTPSALAPANIAALANAVSGVPMTLVSSTGSGITTGVSIINYNTGLPVTGLLGIDIPTAAVTGSIANSGAYGTLTVTTAATTPLSIGMTVTGAGVASGTVITGFLTGGGYLGTYTVNNAQTVGSTTLTGTQLTGYNVIPFGQAQTVQLWNPTALMSRCVSITGVASGLGGNFLVQGYDVYGVPMSQLVTVGAGVNTVNSTKAFKYIAAVTPQFTDAHTYSVGTADVYGFPMRSDVFTSGGSPSDVAIWWNGAQITATLGWTAASVSTATTTTGDVRGTYAVQSASGGGKQFVVVQSPLLPNTISATGLFGVNQI